ncbi:MAG: glycosyltransferase family 2 protein [Gemmatimonadetes bacterium]|nr:glycosyltransferase family 2 protein [Gemmatimonadota bacterium]
MTPPTVWVVAPVHNRRHFTEPFLACLHRQTYGPIKVVIFDDGSTDGTSDMIRTKFPNVITLRGDGNVWWTASVNRAVHRALSEAAAQDYILVMNDDVEVEPGFVETLVRLGTAHPKSLVGALHVDLRTTRIDDGGVIINWWTAKHSVLNRGRRPAEFAPGHFERCSYLTGRAALIPSRVFREMGPYDEQHFLNCADTELPVRAARRGYELLVCYGAAVHGHVQAMADENKPDTYRLGMLGRYFFGVKSYARLNYRFYFARTGAGPNPIRLAAYLVADFARITAYFIRGMFSPPITPVR